MPENRMATGFAAKRFFHELATQQQRHKRVAASSLSLATPVVSVAHDAFRLSAVAAPAAQLLGSEIVSDVGRSGR
jgi:hypothetical protein